MEHAQGHGRGHLQRPRTKQTRTAIYMEAQGLPSRRQPTTRRKADFIDIDNYIDYLLVNWYTGNNDWPHKNYYLGRERDLLDPAPLDGSRTSIGTHFFSWDAEWSLFLNSNNDLTGGLRRVSANPTPTCATARSSGSASATAPTAPCSTTARSLPRPASTATRDHQRPHQHPRSGAGPLGRPARAPAHDPELDRRIQPLSATTGWRSARPRSSTVLKGANLYPGSMRRSSASTAVRSARSRRSRWRPTPTPSTTLSMAATRACSEVLQIRTRKSPHSAVAARWR